MDKILHIFGLNPCELIRLKEIDSEQEHLLLKCKNCGELKYYAKSRVG